MTIMNTAPNIEAMYANEIQDDDDLYLRLMSELASKYPKEKKVYLHLGMYYRDEFMFAEAEQAYNEALRLDPDYGEALNAVAYMYAAKADYGQAIEYFGRYAEVNPDEPNPHDSIGEMYYRMGRLDESIAAYERALAIRPDFGSERGIAYVYGLKQDYDEAIAQ